MTKKIFLIGSTHSEKGLSSVIELLNTLYDIKPEVIFGESSEKVIRAGIVNSLEHTTIKLYKESNDVQIVPVDIDIYKLLDFELQEKIQKLFNTFRTYHEYCKMETMQDHQAYQFGFPYLNSLESNVLIKDMNNLQNLIVDNVGNSEMRNIYDTWLGIHDKRERKMLTNIIAYSVKENYKTGVFIVGANHIPTLKDKIMSDGCYCCNEIKWDFDYFNN